MSSSCGGFNAEQDLSELRQQVVYGIARDLNIRMNPRVLPAGIVSQLVWRLTVIFWYDIINYLNNQINQTKKWHTIL